MADKTDGVLDPLKCAVHCVREHRGPVRGAEMEQAVAKVAELLAADEEYDDAWELYEEGETGPGIIAAFDRATAATERRAAAIRAMRGEPPVG